MGNQNFAVKWTLKEANTAERALQHYLNSLMEHIDNDEDRMEAGRVETILRRDFS